MHEADCTIRQIQYPLSNGNVVPISEDFTKIYVQLKIYLFQLEIITGVICDNMTGKVVILARPHDYLTNSTRENKKLPIELIVTANDGKKMI